MLSFVVGGQFHTLLDLGCGPGNATRRLAQRFDKAYGVDASDAMIAKARKLGGTTKSGERIAYTTGRAEDVGSGIVEAGGYDLVSGGMAVCRPRHILMLQRTDKVLKAALVRSPCSLPQRGEYGTEGWEHGILDQRGHVFSYRYPLSLSPLDC